MLATVITRSTAGFVSSPWPQMHSSRDGSWERNTRAIAFYRKSGYSEVGVKTFVLGTDRQTGLILTRSLGTDGD